MTGPQQILIVEDEPLIAMMLEDFLDVLDKRSAGIADNVASALARIEQGGIDAAILDLNLRGGEKSTPIAEVLATKGIPFLFATGGSDDSVDPRFRDRPCLSKPFTMDGVQQALEAL
ncbi:MAG: sensory transduction regulatory protein [Sphingomonas bacterium]|uniref:response regulator n=1 Tax=Sphingomonas bacterium TaxID=1895847 RepID=UPI00262CFA0E|nr:response regulator [Sphingomonas bacterium]MDB5695623.1 sensory transduction regulatory protein [Sphingomonas bacterium]